MRPCLEDLPLPLLALVCRHAESEDLGRLACCSRGLRSRTYLAWPVTASALILAARHGLTTMLRTQLEGGGSA